MRNNTEITIWVTLALLFKPCYCYNGLYNVYANKSMIDVKIKKEKKHKSIREFLMPIFYQKGELMLPKNKLETEFLVTRN